MGCSLNTSKEAMTKILILVDEAPWRLRPWGKLPPLPLPLGGPALGHWARYAATGVVSETTLHFVEMFFYLVSRPKLKIKMQAKDLRA